MGDWDDWHREYDQPGSGLARRLVIVQRLLREALDRAPAGPLRLVSMCAGQGRNVLGVLPEHPRRNDVAARLVELDPGIAAEARAGAAAAGLDAVEVVTGDAGVSDAYAGAVPAEIVLACGVFGNISDDDIANTVEHLPELCAPGAVVLWTRGRWEPDVTPAIREWFAAAGFEELAFVAPPDTHVSVGAHRLTAEPRPFVSGTRYFAFTTGKPRPGRIVE
ncbi:MAG TPA: class I SAM-dependent methyltransferase family protein [Acidimicrobiales bacterium]